MDINHEHAGWHVVVNDPNGDYLDGSLVTAASAAVLRSLGVIVLPVDPELFAQSGVGGYMRRAWGSGVPFDGYVPAMRCPLLLSVQKQNRALHWVARITPTENKTKHAGVYSGSIRLIADSGQPGTLAGGFSGNEHTTVEASQLGELDALGGWTVGGSIRLQAASDGLLGLGLFGSAPGLRVTLAAVSTTQR